MAVLLMMIGSIFPPIPSQIYVAPDGSGHMVDYDLPDGSTTIMAWWHHKLGEYRWFVLQTPEHRLPPVREMVFAPVSWPPLTPVPTLILRVEHPENGSVITLLQWGVEVHALTEYPDGSWHIEQIPQDVEN